MNHLAHLFLAPNNPQARVGSLLGDFARGVAPGDLPPRVREGLYHHRAVDAFTDRHPEVIASKRLFSPQRRRFAGVALDILYDHYLLRNWQRFSHVEPDTFIDQVYQELDANWSLMPESMQRVTQQIVHHDWFRSYMELENIGYALDRVAGRIRFTNAFSGIIEEIEENDAELERRFLQFFPELKYFAKEAP
ncbi:ACP phosphodiesterase [Marinobacter sp. ATCH36]|uniref:acyl carrier protein phosphodiesterase n=1 Tax=Marinobacter sp. ATCH36 TaxID=2945106 RepID=UPI002021EA63|nr:ACP phosphodiesterase [Marinobacter sp. ATCH36]MCL7944647.1 ACP phosphodiesterase [Marinobacter sp. ATCH36]